MIAYLGDIVFPETLPDINALMNVAKGADARLRIDDDQTVMVDPQPGPNTLIGIEKPSRTP